MPNGVCVFARPWPGQAGRHSCTGIDRHGASGFRAAVAEAAGSLLNWGRPSNQQVQLLYRSTGPFYSRSSISWISAEE